MNQRVYTTGMLIQSTHDVIDHEGLRLAVKRVPRPPQHMRLLAMLPTRDHSRVTCVWRADSVGHVKKYVESIAKEKTRNTYVALDERSVTGFERT